MEISNCILVVSQFFLLFYCLYVLGISLFGFGKPKQQKQHEAQKRFLILIPAHNEENVIGNLLENCKKLEYPKELYTVCVIADNCSDRTAHISRSFGASVIEHTSLPGEPKGKPHAIRYAIDMYGPRLTKDFDGVVFLDADNLMSYNFLQQMNNHLCSGDRLIQAYLDSKNPQDNYVTLGYAAAYYLLNRALQLAKSRLGLGNSIGGTGFCVETRLLAEVGWTARSLTEDLEFTMQCLLQGVPCRWSHSARVYDEKPEDLQASITQRLRWARGHWDVLFKYAPKLLWRSLTKFDIMAFDGMLYLLNPIVIVLSTIVSIIVALAPIADEPLMTLILPWQWSVSLLLFQLAYIAYSISNDCAKKLNFFTAFLALMFYITVFIPLYFWSLFTWKNKTWKPTLHNRAITANEMNIQ